ncbi:MAG: cupredoxin domain-containing protein [Bacilli bacterium]
MRSAHRFALWRLLPGALVLFAVALSGCGTNSAAAGKEGQATPSQNGEVGQMLAHPLRTVVGKPFTIAFVNAGPNESSAFHVVGSTLRTVDLSGNPADALHDVQTVDVPPGDGILVTLQFAQSGAYPEKSPQAYFSSRLLVARSAMKVYPFVSHDMRQFARGAVGRIVVASDNGQ